MEVEKHVDSNDMVVDGISSPDPNRCSFYLTRKKRYCRLNRLSGNVFCAEHVPVTTVATNSATRKEKVLKRQPCPLDPKHTVAIENMEKHLRKCNSRPPSGEYYQPDANTISKTEEEGDDRNELNILTMTQPERVELILKLINFHRARVPSIPNCFGIHEHLTPDFVRTDVGESAIRHSTQIAAIAKIMEDYDLLKDSTCFIEFGSGRGGLSFGLARVVKSRGLKNCKFLLIDRTSPRYKKDNRAKTAEYGDIVMERIKISIEDLLVGKLPGIKNYENIVGIAKHLCGSGTDVALRSLLEEKSNSERSKVRGLVFATCCHHRTEFDHFMGNQFLTSDFSGGNFRALRQIAAWATNGDYMSTYLKDISLVSYETLRFLNTIEAEGYPEIKLKKTVGRLVKEIMDYCRAQHIKEECADLEISCELVNYVDLLTTRENVAIVSYPKAIAKSKKPRL